MNRLTRKRLRRKLLKKMLSSVNGLLALGDQVAVIYFVDDIMSTSGHQAITSLVAPMQQDFQSHPEFLNIDAVVNDKSLPEPPVIDKYFTFDRVKEFFRESKILEVVLGTKMPGYGNPENKPTWWKIEWKSVNSSGFTKAHLHKLIIDIYAHRGIDVIVGAPEREAINKLEFNPTINDIDVPPHTGENIDEITAIPLHTEEPVTELPTTEPDWVVQSDDVNPDIPDDNSDFTIHDLQPMLPGVWTDFPPTTAATQANPEHPSSIALEHSPTVAMVHASGDTQMHQTASTVPTRIPTRQKVRTRRAQNIH